MLLSRQVLITSDSVSNKYLVVGATINARRQFYFFGILSLLLSVATWRRSGDPFIDWGRELYAALSVSRDLGIPLDLLALFGPLSPWINGTVLSIGSESTAFLLLFNLALLTVALLLVHDTSRRFFGSRAAFLTTLAFIFFSAFPQLAGVGNYNFLTPYSHGATHGFLLGFLTLAAVSRGLRSDESIWWILAGAAATLAIGTKPEMGAAALLLLTWGAIVRIRLGPTPMKTALFSAIGAALSLVVLSALLKHQAGASALALLTPYRNALAVSFMDLPFYSFASKAEPVYLQILIGIFPILLLLVAGLWPAKYSPKDKAVQRSTSACRFAPVRTGLAASALFVVFTILFPFSWMKLARTLPWISLSTLFVCAWKLRPASARLMTARQLRRAGELGCLAVFSSVLILKTGLDSRFFQYGFVLSAPAMVLAIGLLSHDLPARARLQGASNGWAPCIAQTLVMFLVMASASQSAVFYSRRTVPMHSDSDLLYLSAEEYDARTPVALELLSYLSASESFRDGAVIIPEGSMFHYMLRTPSAIPIASLMPLELKLLTPPMVLGMIES
ncbi:MAG: glycosyltransferase family 39 protein, partial [Gemmatimonadota bacterium]